MQDYYYGAGFTRFHHLGPTKPPTASAVQPPSNFILPEPTYTPPNPLKKSHARKQPVGHIPRPRNAFILFRCDFVRQKKIPQSVENDHRNISRIVGRIWREMSDAEKDPWVKMADAEKRQHFRIHPGYRFSRGVPSQIKKARRGGVTSKEEPTDLISTTLSAEDALYTALDRAASCPPGTVHVPTVNVEHLYGYGSPSKTRDDLARRPSLVTLYQSTPYDLSTEYGYPDLIDNVSGQDYAKDTSAEESFSESVDTEEDNMERIAEGKREASGEIEERFFSPRSMATRYPVPGIDDPPEWEHAHFESHHWTDWNSSPASTSTSIAFAHLQQNGEYSVNEFQGSAPSSYSLVSSTMLPPLPRSSLPYPFEEYPPSQTSFSTRKPSSFFSPRTGTWKLPLPVLNNDSADSADPMVSPDDYCADRDKCVDQDFHRLSNSVDASVYKATRESAKTVMQELSRNRFGEQPSHPQEQLVHFPRVLAHRKYNA